MPNKKVTDLNSYSATEISQSGGIDLFIITDVANQETKKITAYEFATYAKTFIPPYTGSFSGSYTGSFSGSFIGTASAAITALSASYLINAPSGSSGENVGTTGIGVYKQLYNGVLQFKNLNPGQNISLVNDVTNNVITINASDVSTNPGGPQYAVQYNAPGSVFSGDSGFTYTPSIFNSTPLLSINGNISATLFTATIGANQIGFVGSASYALNAGNSTAAVSSSYALSASNAATASYVSGATTGVLSSYSVVYATLEQGASTTPTQLSEFSITITPKTATSKFIINLGICLSTAYANKGTAIASLYKDSTPLLPNFIYSTQPLVGMTYMLWPANFIDTATDLSPRTYNIRVHSINGGTWLTNAGGKSTMTILEVNY